jgi:hypothetical protein
MNVYELIDLNDSDDDKSHDDNHDGNDDIIDSDDDKRHSDDNSVDHDDVYDKGNNIVINHKYDHHNHPHSA